MSDQPVLSQNEVDALMDGMNSGAVSTESLPGKGEVRSYDLGNEARIVRGRMPMLEMINERFARLYRVSLYKLMRRAPVLVVDAVQSLSFGEYLKRMQVPTSVNMVKLLPLQGTGLIVMTPELISVVVDNYFGGNGRKASIGGRDFTVTENRIVQMLLQQIFVDLKEAWSQLLHLQFEYQSSESNPQFANVMNHTELVVVSTFRIELDGGAGELHVTLPYSMLEPLRDMFNAGRPSEHSDTDQHWSASLREEIEDADVTLNTLLGRTTLSLAELINLKPGDVIPCDFTGKVTVFAEDVPLFRGGFGISRGQQAVRVEERLARPRSVLADLSTSRSGA